MLQRRFKPQELTLYGKTTSMRLADTVGRMHKTPNRPLRVVAVEPLTGQRGRQGEPKNPTPRLPPRKTRGVRKSKGRKSNLPIIHIRVRNSLTEN